MGDEYIITPPSPLPKGSEGRVLEHADNGVFEDGHYWWYVRFGDYEGWCAEDGLALSTQPNQPPNPPTITSPGSSSPPGPEISTITPTFQWTGVFGADYYGLYISEYPYGSANLVFESDKHYGPLYGTSLSLPGGYLENGKKYRWDMNSYNSEGGWGAVSSNRYFQVGVTQENHAPNPPNNLAQLKSDCSTIISVGGTTNERKVYFKGTVSDSDGDKVCLQIELRNLNEYGGQFDETKGGLFESALVESGNEAIVSRGELIDENYHWRARTVDEHGVPSEWKNFGGNDISAADFVVFSNDKPPKASFTFSPENPKVGEWVFFNASNSEDDGDIVLYEWDMGNTGFFNDRLADPKITYYWETRGTKQVRLRVTDNCGALGEIVKDININENSYSEKFWGYFEKKHKITDEELKKIKQELNIYSIPYPYPEKDKADPFSDIMANRGSNVDLYMYRDSDFKRALDKEISKETPGLTYGVYLLNAIEEMRYVEDIWIHGGSSRASVFFNTMLDINTGWGTVADQAARTGFEGALREPYSAGASIVLLSYDVAQLSVSMKNIKATMTCKALYLYLFEREGGASHKDAWEMVLTKDGEAQTQDYRIPPRAFLESEEEYARRLVVLEDYFEHCWEVYGDAIRQNQLDMFRYGLKNRNRAILYSVLQKHKPELLDWEVIGALSPVELLVYDSNGNVTGVMSGDVKEDIINSIYGDRIKSVVIFNATDSYIYEVKGTDNGTYGLNLFSLKNGTSCYFSITNISIRLNETHQYLINWTVLSQGEGGVTVRIDADGDSYFEKNTTIQPPIANYTYSPDKPIVNQTITFNASNSVDKDGNITSYEWIFGEGSNGTGKTIAHTYSLAGDYNVILTITDDDGAQDSIFKVITVSELEENILDTRTSANPYPSISGTHNGTITPSCNISVSKLYTYPCTGTGGHAEYAKISNKSWSIETLPWNGYQGDWHNITFNKTFTLYANETYNYTIRTGSYPQIIHESSYNATGGVIACDEFVDVNGRKHEDWIPAIRLWS
ncbi:MAG: PKD domain-containing protein [Candidatus Bathyarchaeia archaeon]|nr:PKD domain-containing protein [Candidatus Bathyarchaeia archaeon]